MKIRFLRKGGPVAGNPEVLELTPDAELESFGLDLQSEAVTIPVVRHGRVVVVFWKSEVGTPTFDFAQAIFKEVLLEKTLLFLSEKGDSFLFTKESAALAQ